VRLEKIYIAPEAPGQPSRGRKPSPQYLFDARDEFNLNLAESFMVGDKMIDLECGWNAGVKKSILVRTGYGAKLEHASAEKLKRAVVVDDLDRRGGLDFETIIMRTAYRFIILWGGSLLLSQLLVTPGPNIFQGAVFLICFLVWCLHHYDFDRWIRFVEKIIPLWICPALLCIALF